ncbi:tetratricopeptide repeat protein [Schlesneria sp.]|uniref:tetratricopeptide repeat protein n=1 Tax=Schlesneria sp. TaxID=2762018 RepID=UPI002F19AE79
MFVISSPHYVGATLLALFALSGCQLPAGKWPMGLTGKGKSDNRATAKDDDRARSGQQIAELMEKGDALRKDQQYDEARVVYQRALMISPQSPDIHHRLAILADKQKQFEVADQHYDAALKIHPNDVNLLSDHGYSYMLRGNLEKSEKTLKKALKIDASNRAAMANLGSLYARQDRYSEAQALFRAGTSEAEAEKYLAQLFPDRVRSDLADKTSRTRPGAVQQDKSVPSSSSGNLSLVSTEELQAEMQRRTGRGKSGKSVDPAASQSLGTTAQISWDDQAADSDDVAADAHPQGVPVPTDRTRRSGNGMKSDSQVKPARGQSALASLDLIPSESTAPSQPTPRPATPRNSLARSSSQRATEFGLNVGPGNLFSVVTGIETTSSPDSAAMAEEASEPAEELDAASLPDQKALQKDTEGAAEWEQTTTRRTTTAEEADHPGSEPEFTSSSTNSRPYQGLWPNNNQLPEQSGLERDSRDAPDRVEFPTTTRRAPSRGSWDDTVGDDKGVSSITDDENLEESSLQDSADSWP